MNPDDNRKNQGAAKEPKSVDPRDILRSPTIPLDDGFDRTSELVDRMIDDIIEKGAPCMETITELVDQAAYTDPRVKKPEDE